MYYYTLIYIIYIYINNNNYINDNIICYNNIIINIINNIYYQILNNIILFLLSFFVKNLPSSINILRFRNNDCEYIIFIMVIDFY